MGAGNESRLATSIHTGDTPGQDSVHGRGVFGRISRIGLKPDQLTTAYAAMLDQIVDSCPACDSPEHCEAELKDTAPTRGWDDWDEYCPNAARLRVLAALSMFTPTGGFAASGGRIRKQECSK